MKTFASKTYSIFAGASVFLSVSTAPLAAPLAADADIQTLEAAAGGAAEIGRSQLTGQVNFISTEPGRAIPLNVAPGSSAEQRALAFIDAYGDAFGLNIASQVKITAASGKDDVGMEHVRLQQLHKGVPVTAGEMTLHLKGDSVVSVLAKTLPGLESQNVTPKITADEAAQTVRNVLAKSGIDDVTLSDPRLEIFNKGLLQDNTQPTRLAWFIEARKIDVRRFIWIDAETGAVLLNFSQLAHARNRKIYDANNSSTLPGTLVRSEGQPATGDNDVDKAYDFSGDTYDYFKKQHNRDSYDGKGAALISTTHYCETGCPFENAFWNGEQMVYGEGFSAADDVDAHELTHAVTEHSAGLFYYMQSGALNESFSDIFGETVDLTNGKGTDTAAVRWLLGEDLPASIGVIRNMKNPGQHDQPGKVKDPKFVCDTINFDQGGVHFNSGVPNLAYVLMADGGTFNGKTVSGIGLTKAGKIQYRVLTKYLVSGSNFLDNFNALKRSCKDLIGTAGITSANCSQVNKAITAVQMNSPVCNTPLPPALCPSGKTVKNLYFNNFDAGLGSFALSDTNIWGRLDFYAKSEAMSLYGGPPSTTSDSNAKMTNSIKIPAAGAKMQFDHSFEFEKDTQDPTIRYDGGVVEFSTDGGKTWKDAGGLMKAGVKYNGSVSNCCTNPLKGKKAFTAESAGYSATQLDLATLAGKSVRFRFRIGSDEFVQSVGWIIDNVRIYQCQ